MARVFLTRTAIPLDGYGVYHLTQPLGLLYVAGALRAAGHEIKIVDQRLRRLTPRQVAEEARAFDPDVFGVGGLSVESDVILQVAREARALLPRARIVAGGPHASGYSEDLLATGLFDAAVAGESERSFPAAVAAMARGEDPGALDGVATASSGGKMREQFGAFIEDLDAIPMPAWDLLPDFEAYRGRLSSTHVFSIDLVYHHPRFAPMFTSRACPYRCVFCVGNVFGKIFRAHSPERVLEEMKRLYADFGVREFQFVDDIFNCDLERAKEICRRIAAWGRKVYLAFPVGLRADDMDDELIDLLARAGAVRAGYGVESASPRMQKVLEKYADLDKTFAVIRKTSRRGILTRASFTIGNPTETEEEILKTIEWARRSDLQLVNFSRLVPFKGTTLHDAVRDRVEERERAGDFSHHHFTDDPPVNVAAVDAERAKRLRALAYRRFFSRPRRLWTLFLRWPHKERIAFFLLLVARKAAAGRLRAARERMRAAMGLEPSAAAAS